MVVTRGDCPGGYAAFAAGLQATAVVMDPFLDGRPRFRQAPLVIDERCALTLATAAEAVAAAYDELARIVARDPALLDDFFRLSRCQKLMWLASAPLWHGLARADVFLTADGARICELNSDTPSGQAEAVILGRMATAEHPALRDPNAGLLPRFLAMIETFARRVKDPGKRLTAGIVYPTEFPEDLPMIELYRRCLHDRGHEVVLGSPLNLAVDGNLDLCLFGRRVDVLIRHYKTDWWGERMPVWRDVEPYADPAPLDGPLDALLSASLAGRVAVVNPMGAVLTQNKRSLAFMHEAMDRFSDGARETIRRYVPPTFRLETLDPEALGLNQEEWVLKSDYGCEGDEVIIGKDVDGETWRDSLARAIPERWVAQRRFSPRSDCAGHVVNHGVYLVAGEAAGIYGRTHRGATDVAALSLPVLIAEEIGDA